MKDGQSEPYRRVKEVYNAASPAGILSKRTRLLHFIEDQVGNCHWVMVTAQTAAGAFYVATTPADASYAWTDRTPAVIGVLPTVLNAFTACSFNQSVVLNAKGSPPKYWNPTVGGLFLPIAN